MKIEISLVQILSIVVIVFSVFVLPAQFISYLQSQSAGKVYTASQIRERASSTLASGQVAGISTTNGTVSEVQILGRDLTLDNEMGVLLIAALIVITLMVIIALYMMISAHIQEQANAK